MQRTVIDERYKLVEPLGDGGMARVYLAHDEVLDRDVALKVLREQYADDEEFVERFRWEARSAARLSHPNIVSVYDQGLSESGAYYMAMEYVPRGTLKDRIRQEGALAPDAATGVALQIADALCEAHEKGVIHRDIKPQNVLVTGTGDVKVADFGIARAASSTATATGLVLGTAGYMSPEQAKGEPVGPQSDLYSLGVVLYEMLTGNLPYEADSALAQAIKHISEPPPSPREANPEVSEALDTLTMRLLAKDPEDRYPSAGALANDLERVWSGLPLEKKTERMTAPLPLSSKGQRTTVRPPVGAPGGGRRRRGRLFPALVALLFGVVLFGGLASWALTRDPGAPEPDSSGGGSGAEEATVPDTVGSVTSEAERALSQASLKPGRQEETPSEVITPGAIADQNPTGGTAVKPGTAVDLTVSTGSQQAPAQNPNATQSAPAQATPPAQPTPAQTAPPQPTQSAPAPPQVSPQPVQATPPAQPTFGNGDNGGGNNDKRGRSSPGSGG